MDHLEITTNLLQGTDKLNYIGLYQMNIAIVVGRSK
jgi:hypothetical protein